MLGRSHTGRGGRFVQQGLSVKAKKTHQMLIGWRIVNVFPILFGKCRPAFVDHSRQDHEPAQPDAKAARLKFASRRSRYQSRPGKIIYDLTLGSGFVGSAKAD